MTTRQNLFSSRTTKWLVPLCLALAFGTSAARAGLTLDLYLYTVNQRYVFYTPLTTNATPPAAPLGTYFIYSPQQPTNGSWRQLELTTNGMATITGGENNYGDYASVMQQITNGFWWIVVTNATSTNTYRFTVSAPNMSSNLLPFTSVTFPAEGATQVTNQPTFTWEGPNYWPVASFAEAYQFDPSYSRTFYENASIPAGQTNWTIPVPIPAGTNTTFSVSTATNWTTPLFVATPPLNTNNSQPIAGWASTTTLASGGYVNFTTAPSAAPGIGHTLIAHYSFDNSGDLGQDSSGHGNDMNGGSSWGPLHEFATDAAAGGGAVEFFGTSSITPSDSTRTNWNMTLAGSFSISAWVKTTASRGNDDDNAYFGATIFWAFNDQNATNDTIPLAITGSKAAFTTRGEDSGAFTTLHSGASVNDGNYHLITVTRNQPAGEMKIYVDGNFEASEVGTTAPLNGNDYYLSIGGTLLSSYSGLLDDVQIYSGVLSSNEVAALHSNPGSTAPDVSIGDLQAHYDFDEGAVLAPDVSGNGNPVVHAGNFGGSGPAISLDTIAGAGSVYFDGSSYLTASSNLLATIAKNFSVSVWVKTSQSVGSPGDMAYWGAAIVSADMPTGGVGDAVPIALTGGQVAFNTGDGYYDETLNSIETVNDDTWHHVVVTRNQATGEKAIYIDGAFANSSTGTTELLNGPQLLTIGAKSDASNPDPASPDLNGSNGYEGLLDDLQIYKRVLSSAEVAYLHAHPGATVGSTNAPPYPVEVEISIALERKQELDGTETYLSFPEFNSINPSPTTTNLLTSPHGYFVTESDPSSSGSSSLILRSLGEVLNEWTNGLWTLYVNQSSPTQQVYTFSVSVSGLDTNLLRAARILSPTNGAQNVPTAPSYYWSGPSNFSSLLVDIQGGSNSNLPPNATNWSSPPVLTPGTNLFEVAYASNDFPSVTFTTPVDAGLNPVTSWTTHVVLRASAFSQFVVVPTPLPVRLTNVISATGRIQFAFTTLAGRSYIIEARTNVNSGTWQELTNVTGAGTLQQFSFPNTNPPVRFFRVRSL